MKTAESIEAQEERKATKPLKPYKDRKLKEIYGHGKHPNSHTAVGGRADSFQHRLKPYQFPPGVSGNPKGRPKGDVAAHIAREIFLNNQEALYKAYGRAALKGNAYAFKELADRAFGKMKDKVEYEVTEYREVSEKALIERIQQLEQSLGFAGTLEPTGGVQEDPSGTPAQALTKTN